MKTITIKYDTKRHEMEGYCPHCGGLFLVTLSTFMAHPARYLRIKCDACDKSMRPHFKDAGVLFSDAALLWVGMGKVGPELPTELLISKFLYISAKFTKASQNAGIDAKLFEITQGES